MANLMTKAYVLERIGYDGLNERIRKVPETAADEVLVRMRAASLNFRDLKILKGIYARNPTLPVVLLSDGAGDVVNVGANVERFRTGDRVMPIYMAGWHRGPLAPSGAGHDGRMSLGGDIDGTGMEYFHCHQDNLVAIPDSLSYEEAACLPCAAVTAWHALVYLGDLKAGDTVLAMGSGGVSLFALQFARISGARVIATSSDDPKLRRLIELGAADGINYNKTAGWGDAVRKLTDGRGVDHVVEVGGSGTIKQSIRATRDGGCIEIVGNLSGEFPADTLAERGIRMTPLVVGSREMTEDMLRAIDMHGVKPIIDRQFAFADLKQALAYLETGKHFGKILVTF